MQQQPPPVFTLQQLQSNHYQIRINPEKPIYKYKFKSTSLGEGDERTLTNLKKYSQKLKALLSYFFTQGNMIFSPTKLDPSTQKHQLDYFELEYETEQISDEGQDQRYCLENLGQLTFANDPSAYRNLVSRQLKFVLKNQKDMIPVGMKGSKLFMHNKARSFDQYQVSIWPGFEIVLNGDKEQMTLLIDQAFKVINQVSVLDKLNEMRHNGNLDLSQFESSIVMTTYNKRFYTVVRVDPSMSPKIKFSMNNKEKKEEATLFDYYKMRWNLDVNPNQPLLRAIDKTKKKDNQAEIFLLPQFCLLTGLSDSLRNNFNAMKAFAEMTKPPADLRIDESNKFINQLQNTSIVDKSSKQKVNVLEPWGIQMCPVNLKLDGRLITSGDFIMGSGKHIQIVSRDFDRAAQTEMFDYGSTQQTAREPKVIIIVHQNCDNQFGQFYSTLEQAIKEYKFPIQKMKDYPFRSNRDNELISLCQSIKSDNPKIDLIIFLLNGQKKKAALYTVAKRIALQMLQIPSQVLTTQTISNARGLRSVVNKVLVQICAKIGGTPWVIDGLPPAFQVAPTMVCGMDIFHKISENKPSQLAFCSTYDKNFSKYYSQVISDGEFSTHLQIIMEQAMKAFREKNRIFPQRVIVYRDGVGAGQEAILQTEAEQFRLAFKNLNTTVLLILILCNKRVSTKFYSRDSGNPSPGTLVDKMICDNNDYYLISQKTTQGTATPTQYKTVINELANEQNIADQLKVLTFKLCYLYYNWCGTIKIPAPVRYAHCLSNFIGDRYQKQDQIKFLPTQQLAQQMGLYYI